MRAGASLRPKIHTVAQKMLLEKGGGTQNVYRCVENAIGEGWRDTKREPFVRNAPGNAYRRTEKGVQA